MAIVLHSFVAITQEVDTTIGLCQHYISCIISLMKDKVGNVTPDYLWSSTESSTNIASAWASLLGGIEQDQEWTKVINIHYGRSELSEVFMQ